MNIHLANPPAFFYPLAIGLSVVTVAFLLAALVDLWRRPDLPTVTYGEITLSRKRMRWIWVLGLLGALGFSVNEDPISERRFASGDLEALENSGSVRRIGFELPLPFYHLERARYQGEDGITAEEGTEAIVLPWSLLSALFAYWILVRRWNPENRFALRLLWGRRWKKEAEAPQ